MKLQIDTVAKTIKVENSVKITELISAVKKLLPNDWKDYSLEAVTVINNWYNPFLIQYTEPYSQPSWPYQPTICDAIGTINIDYTGMSETVCTNSITNN